MIRPITCLRLVQISETENMKISQRENRSTCPYDDLHVRKYANMLDWYGNEQSEWVAFDWNIEDSQCENGSTCRCGGLYIWEYANMMSLFDDMHI